MVGISSVPLCFACEARPHLHLVYPALVFGVELAGLFEDPTFSVGMICRFIRGDMYLTYLVQNFV